MFQGLRSYYADLITSASYLVIFLFAFKLDSQEFWLTCMVLVAAVAFLAWFSTYKRAKIISDIATSRIGSAAQGYVELFGRANINTENLIVSPLSATRCVWYRYWIYSKSHDDHSWRQTGSGVSESTFEINDDTGNCVVDPDYAEVIATERKVSYVHDQKHVEELLYAGSVYVLGEFSTVGGANTHLSLKEDVSALLAEWKKDKSGLHKRFDLNNDGEIDLREWELARREAIKEVRKQHAEIRIQTGVHVIKAPRNNRLFLISSLSPQQLRKRYLLWSLFHLAICFSACAVIVKFAFLFKTSSLI
jgi:hypothetical protein